jgi:hypothetical protein
MAQVGPLRECFGPGVVHTDASFSSSWWLSGGYHHVRSVFFVSVLKTVTEEAIFYRGWYFIPFFYHPMRRNFASLPALLPDVSCF